MIIDRKNSARRVGQSFLGECEFIWVKSLALALRFEREAVSQDMAIEARAVILFRIETAPNLSEAGGIPNFDRVYLEGIQVRVLLSRTHIDRAAHIDPQHLERPVAFQAASTNSMEICGFAGIGNVLFAKWHMPQMTLQRYVVSITTKSGNSGRAYCS
jgi:hypothetical protein